MTYLDVKPHIHWKLKGLSDLDCRSVDLVLLSRINIYICHLYVLPKLNCRLVDLSTCRPVDLSNCRPVELVLLSTIKIRLGLGLVCG